MKYKCDLCNYETDNKQSYSAHRRIHSSYYKGAFASNSTIYKCIYCNNSFTDSRSYGAHKSHCRYYWLNNLIDKNIVIDGFISIEFSEIPKIHEISINYLKSLDLLSDFDNKVNKLFTELKSNKSIINPNSKYSGLMKKTLELLSEIPEIKNKFIDRYKELNLYQLSTIFNIEGKTLWWFYKYNLDINIDGDRPSSKVHLQMKPWIESELGYNTITEYRVGKYKIDEYCPDLNLAIEIDGKWCHDKEYDLKRENEIKSMIKCKFLRLDSELDEINVRLSINKFKNTLVTQ